MADMRSLHEKAKACKPDVPLKPTTILVALLKPERGNEGPKSEDDFFWVKCTGKRTVQQVLEGCRAKRSSEDDGQIYLKSGSTILPPQTTMSDLYTNNNQLVTLEVVRESDLPAPKHSERQPLQPTNQQVKQSTVLPSLPKKEPLSSADENRRPRPGSVPLPSPNLPLSYPVAAPVNPRLRSPASITHELHGSNSLDGHLGAPPSAVQHSSPWPVGPHHSNPLAPEQHPEKLPRPDPSIPRPSGPGGPLDANASKSDTKAVNVDDYPVTVRNAALKRYLGRGLIEAHKTWPDKSESLIMAELHKQWNESMPLQHAYYAEQAREEHDGAHITVPARMEESFSELMRTGRHRSMSETSTNEGGQLSFQLQNVLKEAEPDVLETSVAQGLKLLQKLREPLQSKAQDSPEAAQWIQQIENLQKQAVRTKTVIGVVGNTGAGKSSVINAMLEEERLVPTNCMRACTAVVTEISYNDEQAPYRAEIEFINSSDWHKELETMFSDLLDAEGRVSRECSNEDTEAGIAYAKIKAVYPQKTKEDIAKSTIESMLREVSHILGSSKKIEESNSLRFYKRLQHYVDSKEKTTGEKGKDKKKERKEMEFWPLIRVVRLYVKSPPLSTGAVIVDLPGVHDSNAARAAVAEGYMKQCTGLWIVAPITRAVDDKAAKTLLGESFKRQLKMDGGFNAVTFICSKTDDISLSEAQDSLGIEDELGSAWAEVDKLGKDIKVLNKQLDEAKESKTVYTEIMNDADDELEVWDRLKEELENGKAVYAPSEKSTRKRKAVENRRPRKRRCRDASSDSESYDDADSEDDEDEGSQAGSSESEQQALSEDQVAAKISEIRSNKKNARQQKNELDSKIEDLKREIKAARESEQKIEAGIAARCIAGRNNYSKGAIQNDFAAGVKELDQEVAAEEDEENFNPEMEVRDYEEVARSLPVFCVSSRAYQKLRGRLRKEPAVPGFESAEETEMPQLQAHCKELTKAGRSANCKRFINNLSQLLNSLVLWASSDGTGEHLTTEQREREAKLLSSQLKRLEDGLDKIVESTCRELSLEFQDNIYDKYETAVNNATKEASSTAELWGAPVNRENRAAGGCCWSTYKAISRRNGIYSNAQGPHEWNQQLAEPMMKVVASGWEKTFSRRIPMVMAGFVRGASELLKAFHRDIDSRARKVGLGIAGLHGLKQQLEVYESILKDVSIMAKEMINSYQKEINREFVPVIQRAMVPAYEACVAECGPGSYRRMKSAMNGHVNDERYTMFQQSVDEVRHRLNKMGKDVENTMNDKADEVFFLIRRDYRSVLGGGDMPRGQLLPKAQRLLRKEILTIVAGVEQLFGKIALGEFQEVDDVDNALAPDSPRSGHVACTDEEATRLSHDMSTTPDARAKPEIEGLRSPSPGMTQSPESMMNAPGSLDDNVGRRTLSTGSENAFATADAAVNNPVTLEQ